MASILRKGNRRDHWLFVLEECGIHAQYTTHGSPYQNGMAERRNRRLKEMVRYMMSRTNLPIFLWGERC